MMKRKLHEPVILTVLFAVFLLGSTMPVRAIVVTMKGYVISSFTFDVDTGQMVANTSADLFYYNVNDVERYLEPENGALFAVLGMVDFDSLTDLSAYMLSSGLINAGGNDSLPIGTVLIAKTNIGNYAKMRVDHFPHPINFTIVYQTDGTPIVPELSSITMLALFLPTTLLAAILYYRRQRF